MGRPTPLVLADSALARALGAAGAVTLLGFELWPAVTRSLSQHFLYDRIPLCEFLPEVAVRSVGAEAEHRLETRLDELLLKILAGPLRLGDLVEFLQDRLWRAGRREQTEEDLRHEIRQAFLARGRNVRRHRESLGRIHRKDAELSAAMKGHDLRGDVRENDLDLSAKEIVHGRSDAAIRHVEHVKAAGLLLEQLRRDMRNRADAAGAI